MNLSDTSLLAFRALDLAACERELLNWFMAQPRGYAATRHVIADLMHKDLSWVCGRAKALIDADVLESLKAVNGRHPLKLKNAAGQGQAVVDLVRGERRDRNPGSETFTSDGAVERPKGILPAPAAPDTASEAYRHECEIRFVANLPNDAARNKYLTRVHEKRGEAAWKRLREDAWRAMRALDRVAA